MRIENGIEHCARLSLPGRPRTEAATKDMIAGWLEQLWHRREWSEFRDSILIYKAFQELAHETNMPVPGQLIPAMGKVVRDEAPVHVPSLSASREESRRGFAKFKKSIKQYRDNQD